MLVAELFEMAQSLIARVPVLRMPPPFPLTLPFEMLSPEMVTVAPELTVKIVPTVLELLPETVRLDAPGPVIVMSTVIAGRVLDSVIVPVTLDAKVMLLAGVLFAWVIAQRSEPVVVPSLVLVT
ncbi:MAG: hypothetical protein JOZ29_06320 [Deltaproteobacteria bacterium]|nr:hypothetical protein [Deltaproteobacteria bacterium]